MESLYHLEKGDQYHQILALYSKTADPLALEEVVHNEFLLVVLFKENILGLEGKDSLPPGGLLSGDDQTKKRHAKGIRKEREKSPEPSFQKTTGA